MKNEKKEKDEQDFRKNASLNQHRCFGPKFQPSKVVIEIYIY